MNRRMIDCGMWQNSNFAQLPMGARLLQIGLINHADDQGRIKADLMQIKIQIFPCDNISTTEIQQWLELIAANETIILYTVAGKQYAQMLNWWKYQSLQYAQPSKYPRPEGWLDRIRKTVTKGFIATCNWQTVDGSYTENTCDMDGNPLNQPGKPTPVIHVNGSSNPGGYSPESTGDNSGDVQYKLREDNINYNTTALETIRSEDEANSDGSGGGSLPETLPAPQPVQVIQPTVQETRPVQTPPLTQQQSDYAQVCRAFEDNGFGMLSVILSEQIADMLDEYPLAWILSAMRVSVSANKRQLRYVNGILRKWRADGVDPTVQAADSPKPVAAPIQVQADDKAATFLAQLWQNGGQNATASQRHH